MAHLFISYSCEDLFFVERLRAELKRRGHVRRSPMRDTLPSYLRQSRTLFG